MPKGKKLDVIVQLHIYINIKLHPTLVMIDQTRFQGNSTFDTIIQMDRKLLEKTPDDSTCYINNNTRCTYKKLDHSVSRQRTKEDGPTRLKSRSLILHLEKKIAKMIHCSINNINIRILTLKQSDNLLVH